MENPNEADSPDERTLAAISASADQFEEGVRTGLGFMAVLSAHKVVRSLRRFFPEYFPSYCPAENERSEVSLPFSISDPSVHNFAPDPAYTEVVQASVKEFKAALTGGDPARAVAALQPTGILRHISPPAEELRNLEMEAARSGGSGRLPLLPRMAKLALWLGDASTAERYASEALKLVLPRRVDPFGTSAAAIHDANMVAGVVALRRGDIQGAKEYLLASATTQGSEELQTLGPNLTLVDELLKCGERDIVVQYLEQCRQFWKTGSRRLDEWITEIRSGKLPDFGPFLCV
jgi:hypothetical protein